MGNTIGRAEAMFPGTDMAYLEEWQKTNPASLEMLTEVAIQELVFSLRKMNQDHDIGYYRQWAETRPDSLRLLSQPSCKDLMSAFPGKDLAYLREWAEEDPHLFQVVSQGILRIGDSLHLDIDEYRRWATDNPPSLLLVMEERFLPLIRRLQDGRYLRQWAESDPESLELVSKVPMEFFASFPETDVHYLRDWAETRLESLDLVLTVWNTPLLSRCPGKDLEYYREWAETNRKSLRLMLQPEINRMITMQCLNKGESLDYFRQWAETNADSLLLTSKYLHHLFFRKSDVKVVRKWAESQPEVLMLSRGQLGTYVFQQFRLTETQLLEWISQVPDFFRQNPEILPLEGVAFQDFELWSYGPWRYQPLEEFLEELERDYALQRARRFNTEAAKAVEATQDEKDTVHPRPPWRQEPDRPLPTVELAAAGGGMGVDVDRTAAAVVQHVVGRGLPYDPNRVLSDTMVPDGEYHHPL